jgi:hypothetical protein
MITVYDRKLWNQRRLYRRNGTPTSHTGDAIYLAQFAVPEPSGTDDLLLAGGLMAALACFQRQYRKENTVSIFR